MTTNQSYNGFAAHAREATEKSVEAFKLATKPLIGAATPGADAPRALVEPAQQYFQFVQQAVVANVELATKWTELVATFAGAKRFRASEIGEVVQDATDATSDVVKEATDATSDLVQDTAEVLTDAVQATAEAVDDASDGISAAAEERADDTDEQELERVLEAERAEAKHAHMVAREPYLSLTKAELTGLLAERGLPKSGTINTLVERLVAADKQP